MSTRVLRHYDGPMTRNATTDRTAANLELLDRETNHLLQTVAGLTEQDRDNPTLCSGWDVAHLLTHVARNSDALRNLVHWAADGQERQAYASDESRAQAIEDGAARPLSEIVEDLRASAAAFRKDAETLRGPAGEAEVRTRTGNPVTGAQVISMRVLEVVFHHVDLNRGYTFDDTDQDFVARTLRRGVRQWDSGPHPAAALTLLPAGMDPLQLGGGGAEVSGTPGQLLLWLARDVRDGLVTGGQLPAPPPWA